MEKACREIGKGSVSGKERVAFRGDSSKKREGREFPLPSVPVLPFFDTGNRTTLTLAAPLVAINDWTCEVRVKIIGGTFHQSFFGGLDVKETAEALKVFARTVMRDWKLAKAWLLSEMKG